MRRLSPKLRAFAVVCALAGAAGGAWLATQVEDGRERREQSR